MRSWRRGVVSTFVASLLVAACSVAPTPSPTASGSSSPPTSTSVPSSSPTAGLPRPLAWIQIGEVGTATGRLGDLMAFDGGYLGWTAEGDEGYPVAWYSTDGVTWARSDLAKPIKPCPGWVERPDGEISGGAANGGRVVLVGLEYDPGASVCGTWRAAAWVTSDGRSWRRAEGFGGNGTDNRWAYGVWATPDGWEAGISGADGVLSIWRSGDGLQWDDTGVVFRMDEQSSYDDFSSDAAGTRVMAAFDGSTETSRLLVSADGRNWNDATGFPRDRQISSVLAPGPTAAYWTVVTADAESTASEVWVSPDLANWRSAPFPMPLVGGLAHVPNGLLAVGIDPCMDTGTECDVAPPQYFFSPDGSSWTAIDAKVRAGQFVDGRAGVLGVGESPEAGPQPIWRLERYSEEEAYLLAGLRSDARFACAPRRAALPAGAVAAVECSPEGDGVDAIGVFLFGTQGELLDAYFATLSNYDVDPRSGSCPRTAGEIAYVPGDDGPTFGPYRYGCFVNEFGNANYRFTAPDSLVYAGILGTGRNMTALHDWAWQGNQDQPGAPTVWREPIP